MGTPRGSEFFPLKDFLYGMEITFNTLGDLPSIFIMHVRNCVTVATPMVFGFFVGNSQSMYTCLLYHYNYMNKSGLFVPKRYKIVIENYLHLLSVCTFVFCIFII